MCVTGVVSWWVSLKNNADDLMINQPVETVVKVCWIHFMAAGPNARFPAEMAGELLYYRSDSSNSLTFISAMLVAMSLIA